MIKRILPVIALAGLLAWSCSIREDAPSTPAGEQEDVVNKTALVPGEMIIELTDEMVEQVEADLSRGVILQTRSSELNSVFASIGATSVERLYEDAGEWEPRHREAGLHKWYKVKFDPALPQTKAMRSVAELQGIASYEPVRRVRSTAFFNDPYLVRQWHYYNDGTLTAAHKSGCDINVVPVWERYTGGTPNVIVSVVDGGIDLQHEDLAGVCLPGGANGSKNFVDGTYQIVGHGHGTHVAGTIGAINNNGKGVSGIAGGLDGRGGVTLMSCQVFQTNPDDPDKDLSGNFNSAMVWGADHGAVISQNSWGYVYENEADALNGSVGSIKSAIDYFIKNAGIDSNGMQVGPMRGGVVIFAAGNEGWTIGWPAAYEPVVAVGSVAPDYTRAYYSNYGEWVDIAAPGGSTYYESGEILSTVPGSNYTSYQGTSMACPHVSGVAALLVSYYGGPGFTNEMLKERLLGGARNALSPATRIGPLVDAMGSFAYGGKKAPDVVSSYQVSAKSNSLSFNWKVGGDPDDIKAYGYLLLASRDESVLLGADPANLPAGVDYARVEVGRTPVGSDIAGTVSVKEFNAEYCTSMVSYDYAGNYSAKSPVARLISGHNNPPEIQAAEAGPVVLKAFETLSVDIRISDADGHSFSVDFTPGSPAAANALLSPGVYRLTIAGKDAPAGQYEAVYKASDSYGASSEFRLQYQILENHPPQLVSEPDNLIFTSPGEKKALQMDKYFTDPDGEQLTYSVSNAPAGIVHLNRVDNTLNLTTLDYGLANVTIVASDIKDEKVSISFKVLVRDPSSEPDVYPSQVSDFLNVSDGEEKSISIVISNSAGAVLYNESVTCDAFDPARIDMQGWAPGRYGVGVVSGGKSIKRTVVKL